MSMFPDYWGHGQVTGALERMIGHGRIPQTLLFAGPEGVGKATLARRLGAELLGRGDLIERDDLSLPENRAIVAEREKWTAEQRNDSPLFFASHPDFLTFPPEGPLRQISIAQTRWLKEQAALKPSRGDRRIFLIDPVDRAGEQAAHSLLKILEEPPGHLIVILTAANAYDLLPTIRSRSVPFHFAPLTPEEMSAFARARGLESADRRLALSGGSPGAALGLDLEAYERRRGAMLALLRAASGVGPFSAWMTESEAIGRSKSEKLELYLNTLYGLLRDVLLLREGAGEIRNRDARAELEAIAGRASFDWVQAAVKRTDELSELLRRNIQKTIALDALVLELRGRVR
jgi:DNA polymerase III subunit delta'